MNEKLALFREKVKKSENAPLLDALIEHVKKANGNLEYYEAIKIIKHELLERLR